MRGYTATYKPETIRGEAGWTYSCFCDGKLVFDGWTKGKKRDAEAIVRKGIENRNAILAAFANAPLAVA